ncbi:MAG: PA2779 family protein [Gallionellaceae bacterium]|jgi:hypothetical protein
MKSNFMRMTSRLLIVLVLSFSLPMQAVQAEMIATDKTSAAQQTQSDRERIHRYLTREDVVQEMQAQGIDAVSAQARVNALSDEEVEIVAGKLDSLPAGGDIISLLFTIFVVLLITDILGFTKIFPFTRSIR